MGLELATLTPELAARMDLPEMNWRGALVVHVNGVSPLAQVLRPHDVLTAIDNQAIQTAEQAAAILNQHGEQGRMTINFDRPNDGKFEQHTIRLP